MKILGNVSPLYVEKYIVSGWNGPHLIKSGKYIGLEPGITFILKIKTQKDTEVCEKEIEH